MMQQQDIPTVLPYSTDAPSPKARIWAAAIVLLGGLALVGLGGCFLIGVMISDQGRILATTHLRRGSISLLVSALPDGFRLLRVGGAPCRAEH